MLEKSAIHGRLGGAGDCVAAVPGERSSRTLRARAARWLGRCFYACGTDGVPPEIGYLGGQYVLEKVLKHDFLAATVLYREKEASNGCGCAARHGKRLRGTARSRPRTLYATETSFVRQRRTTAPRSDATETSRATATDLRSLRHEPHRLVCKIGRQMHFCLIPLGWLGRLVTHVEVSNLRRCEGIPEVPVVLARPRPNVYVYEYIEGVSLGDKPELPADFFDCLLAAVGRIHTRNVVHFDLHKPGNILVDSAGSPHVIDFQLSMHIGDRALLSKRLSHRLRLWLQSYDIYHVCKHKRRLQPDLLTETEEQFSRNHSLPLRIHRAIAKPYRRVRRACLRYLHARGVLTAPDRSETCPETNPARWARK